MRAADLAVEYPTVTMDSPADRCRPAAGRGKPARAHRGRRRGSPLVLPGTQVLRLAVPAYFQEDPALARVVDEAAADVFIATWTAGRCASACRRSRRELTVVGPGRDGAGGRGADGPHAQPAGRGGRRRRSAGGRHARRPARPGARDMTAHRLDRGGHLRRRLCPHRHRVGPPGRCRPRRCRADAAHRRHRRRAGLLLPRSRHRLERHLPADRHDAHRGRAAPHRGLRVPGHLGGEAGPRPALSGHGAPRASSPRWPPPVWTTSPRSCWSRR